MHKTEEKGPVNYVTAAAEVPPSFEELYPTVERREIYAGSKLFWQTGQSIKFTFAEERAHRVLFVESADALDGSQFRPIIVDLAVLYPVIDPNKAGRAPRARARARARAPRRHLL